MYIQTKDLTASRFVSGHKIALRCHIFDLETFKNANLVCTWYMGSIYQSYTRFSSYIQIFLVYSWDMAVISHIPGVYSQLPIVVSQEMVNEYFEQIKKIQNQMLMKLETDSQGREEKREDEFACNKGTYRSPQKRKHNVLDY